MTQVIRVVRGAPWPVCPLEIADVGEAAAIDAAVFPPERAWAASTFVERHDQGWLLARVRVAGQLVAYVLYGLTEGQRVVIERFAVAPGRQRQGIGRALILHAVKFAVDIGALDVLATVDEAQDLAAQCLLRSCYFRVPRAVDCRHGTFRFIRSLSLRVPDAAYPFL